MYCLRILTLKTLTARLQKTMKRKMEITLKMWWLGTSQSHSILPPAIPRAAPVCPEDVPHLLKTPPCLVLELPSRALWHAACPQYPGHTPHWRRLLLDTPSLLKRRVLLPWVTHSPHRNTLKTRPRQVLDNFKKILFWFSLNIRISWIKLFNQNHQPTLSSNSWKIITISHLT